MVAALVFHGILILLFCAIDAFLFNGKGAFLITGYNTSYNRKALCQATGTMMFTFGGCFFLAGIGTWLMWNWLMWLGYVLVLAVAIVGVIYLNTSKRLKRK